MENKEKNSEELLLNGVHIGEHFFDKDQVIRQIQENCIDQGMNYAVIRPRGAIEPEYLYKWAAFCAEHQVYFMFLYSITYTEERKLQSIFTKEIADGLKKAGGKFYLGDLLGEPGTHYTFKLERYFDAPCHMPLPVQRVKDMQEAKEQYIKRVKEFVDLDCELGIDNIACVEATMFSRYNMEAGVTIPILEEMVGNPEIQIAGVRGTARANGAKLWGTYIAQEWYGGKWHSDPLKQKRLRLAYQYAYLSGSKIFCLESGTETIQSYSECYEKEDPICRQYRDEVKRFTELTKKDRRPAGGPQTKVAFIYGNLDGWGGIPAGSTLWGQFEDEDWGAGAPEYSWQILEEIAKPADWHETDNFGRVDFSGHIPMGLYDIIPAESDLSVLSRYEYLIFVGWNTMTEKIYSNLTQYVEAGGHLLMTAAHLNTSAERAGVYQPIQDGDLSRLFGCRIVGEFSSKNGMKFARSGLIPGLCYPGPVDYRVDVCDPWHIRGYARYADVQLGGGKISAVLDDGFLLAENPEELPIAYVENQCGKGTAMLLTTLEYPGHGAIYPVYKMLVRNLLNVCHENCDIKVYGHAKVRFSVYEGGVVYLLNTDFDCALQAVIETPDRTETITLEPGELKRVEV